MSTTGRNFVVAYHHHISKSTPRPPSWNLMALGLTKVPSEPFHTGGQSNSLGCISLLGSWLPFGDDVLPKKIPNDMNTTMERTCVPRVDMLMSCRTCFPGAQTLKEKLRGLKAAYSTAHTIHNVAQSRGATITGSSSGPTRSLFSPTQQLNCAVRFLRRRLTLRSRGAEDSPNIDKLETDFSNELDWQVRWDFMAQLMRGKLW